MDGRVMTVTPIANKIIDKVVIRLDGREWQLILNFNMICELKQMTGLNALDVEHNLFHPLDPIAIRTLLYLSLREQGAPYTLAQAGNLINPQTLLPIADGLIKAWAASMPRKEDGEQEQGEAAAVASA